MQTLFNIGAILLGYLLGSIPSGLLIVKMKTGKDIRDVESGRTGGTNALRAAGFWAGLGTAVSDIIKAGVAVWLAKWIAPDNDLIHVLTAVAAIIGHNYSIYLPEFDENNKFLKLRGGAGGAPSVGGAMGLWAPSVLIVFPLAVLVFFTIGIASITTISIAVFVTLVFAVRAWLEISPWIYVTYGLIATGLLMWALRPNIKKLLEGNERIVGISLYGKIKAKREKAEAK